MRKSKRHLGRVPDIPHNYKDEVLKTETAGIPLIYCKFNIPRAS